ncbi:MAG: hypothetical protein V3W41_19800 [Planctomycetota bacterium]
MKIVGPLIVTLLVAVAAVVAWLVFRSDGLESRNLDPEPDDNEAFSEVIEDGRPQVDWAAVAREAGMLATGPRAPGVAKTYPGGVPRVVSEMEALTVGRTPDSANTLALKEKILKLVASIQQMSDKEKKDLAEYFRRSENVALKYHLMIAFRMKFGDPFVDPVAEYYDAEPILVGDTLQYMAGRTHTALRALEGILERTVDPLEREVLLGRLAWVGNPKAEGTLLKAFEGGKNVEGLARNDRRAAVAGLARMQSDSAQAVLEALIDGPFEEAYYTPTSKGPAGEELKDLRAHAVMGVLAAGTKDRVRKLLDSSRNRKDEIRDYVDTFFAGVQDASFLPDIVERMMTRGKISTGLLGYIGQHAKLKDKAMLQGLMNLEASDAQKTGLGWMIERLH